MNLSVLQMKHFFFFFLQKEFCNLLQRLQESTETKGDYFE